MGKEEPIGTVVPNQGKLFRMSANSCQIDTMLQNVSVSNGLVWSSDNRFMYYIDTPTRRVEKFDFNLEKGTISAYFLFFKLSYGNLISNS